MNYIEQINRFNRFTERVTRLSMGAQMLWYKLMDIANSAYWPDWVQVGTRTLMELMSVESKNTFHKFRKELIDSGLIEVKRGSRGKLPLYHINEFDETLHVIGSKFKPNREPNNLLGSKYEPNTTPINELGSKIEPSLGSSKGSNPYPNRYPNQGSNNAENEVPSLENYIYKQNKDKNKDQTVLDSLDRESQSSDEDASNKMPNPGINGLVDFWNDHCGAMPKITCVRGKRLTAVKARIREFSEHDVRVAIQNAGESDFLNGKNNSNWMGSFDWIMKPNNFVKVLEGNYGNRQPSNPVRKSGRMPEADSESIKAVEEYEQSILAKLDKFRDGD